MINARTFVRAFSAIALVSVTATSAVAAGAPQYRLRYDAKTGKHCMNQAITGSRIPTRTCATLAEWKTDGLTVIATNAPRQDIKLAAK